MSDSSITLPDSTLASPPAREAVRIIEQLRRSGFVAVLAGGCVRDALLGRTPKDFDVATDATPDSVREVFGKRNTLAFGASFGVIGVLPPRRSQDDSSGSAAVLREPTEVATFRADGNYSDGRRPDSVTFGDAQADALRRDFTINGMFYDPLAGKVLDYVGGLQDLREKHLRTIGDAVRRFDEDKLRMLRAVRFVTTLDLTMQPQTLAAIQEHAGTIGVVSGERIGAEMQRVVAHHFGHRGLKWLVTSGLHRFVWPGAETMDWERLQTRYARMDLLTFETGMATSLLTLHDSIAAATEDLRRLGNNWKLSTAHLRAIQTAVSTAEQLVDCETMPWSRLQPLLIDRDISTTLNVAKAIADPETKAGVDRAEHELGRTDRPLDPPPLVTGNDLIQRGITPGPHFREWLSHLRQAQLDGEISTFDEAIQWINRQDS
ncbi:CCA tRNA nucleotidyltransferase [Neorhodopirellula pilleata]|uniref:tRNA nucleotidyltransferase/poly(A) polymerase n=1 Tax=Neorhodopirellula pilleata TaxID=2714738 RepID=A0A5C6A1L6_9BACT|nr:CCA tRNA nucleotidyltransferase [Neorhodopirellula pilleata]TWT93098.1 tRNA nucleotidyltransferase/poly(A) polymerase [Neorhodopirellula pilleata]